MAASATTHPTLIDLATRKDPQGRIAQIAEILNETNEILDDMVWREGNMATGHKSNIRTGLPAPTWRKYYGGVQPTKSTVAAVTDSVGMLEAYAEVDKALADLEGNTMEFRMTEDTAHIEGMSQEMADTIFFGNDALEPETFLGLAPRFNSLSATNAENIISGGAAGGQTDNSSIWLIVWDYSTVFGIVPKGSTAGIQMTDKGQVTIEDVDGNGGRMEGYRTHYRWDGGIVVRDWRYVVRIPNIDKSTLTVDAASGANLPDLMFQAMNQIPSLSKGRAAWYMSRNILTKLRQQSANAVANSTLSVSQVGGTMITSFGGIPIRRVDVLAADEALVS